MVILPKRNIFKHSIIYKNGVNNDMEILNVGESYEKNNY